MDPPETRRGKTTEAKITTRRRFLRLVVFSVVGAGIAVLSAWSLAGIALTDTNHQGPGQSSDSPSAFAQNSAGSTTTTTTASVATGVASSDGQGDTAPSAPSTPLRGTRVKVMYFQMPQVVSTNEEEEYFILQTPASFGDLRASVLEKHPALSPMIPSMMVLVDGVPAQLSMVLKDGDEVDFIPALAGG